MTDTHVDKLLTLDFFIEDGNFGQTQGGDGF